MNGNVMEGQSGASQSFPAISGFAGYGTVYLDPAGFVRSIAPGFNNVLTIATSAWPPGYRIPNGTPGGAYPASGTTPTGTEPIRIQPPVSGFNRVTFVTLAKFAVTNPGGTVATFAAGLGVAMVNGPSRPMYPYLGYAHDESIDNLVQETLAPGETRTVTMFRSDTVDNNLNGGIPGWPSWTMTPDPITQLYPAVAIAFKNGGTLPVQVTNVFAVGVVL